MTRRPPRIAILLGAACLAAPCLLAFPQQTLFALFIAGCLLHARLRAPAAAALCVLLLAGVAGMRTDTSTRDHHPHHEHIK